MGTIPGWLSLSFQFLGPEFNRDFRGMGYNVPCSHDEYHFGPYYASPIPHPPLATVSPFLAHGIDLIIRLRESNQNRPQWCQIDFLG